MSSLFSRMRGKCPLNVTQTKGPCSQGKMWERLLNRYDVLSRKNSWIIFGDDDDLWHKNRVELYLRALYDAHNLTYFEHISDIRSSVCVTSEQDTSFVKVGDVDEMLGTGAVYAGKTSNYWNNCIRGSIFSEIVNIANDFILQDPMFDCLLLAYVESYQFPDSRGIHITFEPADGFWMYFWRKQEGVCSSLDPRFRGFEDQRDVLRYAVERQMMLRLYRIESTVDNCLSRWTRGADPNDVWFYAWQFGRKFPIELQKKIGIK
jgi:hypothetical protein